MFEKEELIKAIRIQKLGYDLLLWISEEIEHERISFSNVHDDSAPSKVIYEWVNTYYDYLPSRLLPKREELKEFSNYFGSFVSTSFDILEQPNKILKSTTGCLCSVCLVLVNASHLKAKKPDTFDKAEAKYRRTKIIKELAEEEGIDLPNSIYEKIGCSQEYLRDAASLAYAKSLLERIESSKGGVYILVLWRQFAWKPEGSPIKGFELTAEDILRAERDLKLKLKEEQNRFITS